MVDFVCLGGKKCGTTWLYNQLSKNKNLNPSKIKEPNYFGNELKNSEWYESLWDKDRKGLKFECSARYIYDKKSVQNIINDFPNCKFILLIRKHLERSISHYYLLNRNNNTKNFESFLEDNYNSIIDKSLIYPQIKTLEDIGILNKTLILDFDKINKKPKEVFSKLEEFLGVKLKFFEDVDKGRGYIPRNKTLEKIKYSTSEFIIKRLSISPKSFFLFRFIDRLYKLLLTKKMPENIYIKKILIEKYNDLFSEDKKKLKEIYNIEI